MQQTFLQKAQAHRAQRQAEHAAKEAARQAALEQAEAVLDEYYADLLEEMSGILDVPFVLSQPNILVLDEENDLGLCVKLCQGNMAEYLMLNKRPGELVLAALYPPLTLDWLKRKNFKFGWWVTPAGLPWSTSVPPRLHPDVPLYQHNWQMLRDTDVAGMLAEVQEETGVNGGVDTRSWAPGLTVGNGNPDGVWFGVPSAERVLEIALEYVEQRPKWLSVYRAFADYGLTYMFLED